MRVFKGRPIVPGQAHAEALVSHRGFNTLASFETGLIHGDVNATCGDQNNSDLYGKPMHEKALCIPLTIGSTTGGRVLFCAASANLQPACMLFAKPIDSVAAAGVILADLWTDANMPTVDCLGEEFLDYVQTGMMITVNSDGTVIVE